MYKKSKIKNNENYGIDTYGVVYSARSGTPMKLHVAGDGALKVKIANKQKYVHRLVAITFIPNPSELPQVDHIDGNKQNNCVDNLRWCTNAENQAFRYEQCNSGAFAPNTPVMYGTTKFPSINSMARHISNMRGSKFTTVRKEIKAIRYGEKYMYGELCKLA